MKNRFWLICLFCFIGFPQLSGCGGTSSDTRMDPDVVQVTEEDLAAKEAAEAAAEAAAQ